MILLYSSTLFYFKLEISCQPQRLVAAEAARHDAVGQQVVRHAFGQQHHRTAAYQLWPKDFQDGLFVLIQPA